jgi:hypothetical protein
MNMLSFFELGSMAAVHDHAKWPQKLRGAQTECDGSVLVILHHDITKRVCFKFATSEQIWRYAVPQVHHRVCVSHVERKLGWHQSERAHLQDPGE